MTPLVYVTMCFVGLLLLPTRVGRSFTGSILNVDSLKYRVQIDDTVEWNTSKMEDNMLVEVYILLRECLRFI